MAMVASGTISMGGTAQSGGLNQSIQYELYLAGQGYNSSGTATISLNDAAARSLAGLPSGQISLSSFYGKSSKSPAQGTVAGFISGGIPGTVPSPTAYGLIYKFPFTAPFVTAPSIGTLSVSRTNISSASSSTHGYVLGGTLSGSTTSERFPFSASPTTSASVGALAVAIRDMSGNQSTTNGYVGGGITNPGVVINTRIDTFSLSAAPFGTSTQVGNLSQARFNLARGGQSSSTIAYNSGGSIGPPTATTVTNRIDQFPFAAAAPFTATTSGSLSQARDTLGCASSTTQGFAIGGQTPSVTSTVIDKFPYSAPFATASSAGALAAATYGAPGQSSTTNGYGSGGVVPPVTFQTSVKGFPTSAPFTTATTVGNLSPSRAQGGGHSY